MSTFEKDVQKALGHIRYLSETIGGRGSCTEQERLAGEYAARQMRALSLKNIQTDRFEAVPSTYWGFALAFGAAFTGSLLVLLFGGRGVMALGALLNLAGIWGMLAETEFSPSWVRWGLPRKPSQNVTGTISSSGKQSSRVVLCAHLDTHRTPVFFSSNLWYAFFNLLVGLSFFSMVLGVILFGLSAALGLEWVRLAALITLGIQLAGLGLCLSADFTPYSPGANDNASGVGAALAIAGRLRRSPLQNTEVQLVFTGCEEVGDWGMAAYLDHFAAEHGKETVFLVLDEVGLGQLKYLLSDGLLVKHPTHPHALGLAREARRRLPQLEIVEGKGSAYTDALQATKRGLIALTVCTVPAPKTEVTSHWHRITDRVETLNPRDLEATIHFVWTILQIIDETSGPPSPTG